MLNQNSHSLHVIREQTVIESGVLSDEHRVEEITKEILQEKKQVVCSFIQIGRLLDEAKGCLKKEGRWLNWLENNIDISVRMAQRYIQLAKAFPDATSVSHLGMTKALALLVLPEGQRRMFLSEPHEINGEKKKVDDMSVREMRKVIKDRMKSAEESVEEPVEVITESTEAASEVSADYQEQGDGSTETRNYPRPLKPFISDKDGSVVKPERQPESVGDLLESDIESVKSQLDSILKILKSRTTGDVHDKIVNDLRSLHEIVQECLKLTAFEAETN